MKRVIIIFFVVFCFSKITIAQESATKHIVEIKQMKFVPAELFVKKGDTVVWINRDIFTHDVAKFKNKDWQSSPLKKDQSWSKIITKCDEYFCTFHVVMKGKITIEE
jgi:plastocyanin